MVRRALLVGVVCLTLLSTSAVAAAAVSADRVLVVTDDSTGERLLETPVENGTAVEIEYTHSVEKTRVLDAYTVAGTELETDRMEFESYGAGLPSSADVERTDDGGFVFYPNTSYEELSVSLGAVADHRVTVGSETYDLREGMDRRSVTFSVERRSLADRLRSTLGDP